MRYYHQPFFFPLVLILLTLLLSVFMVWALGQEPTASDDLREIQPTPSVDAQVYQAEVAHMLQTFHDRFATAEDDDTKLLTAQTTLESLLNLRVPAELKDFHLDLALAFHQIQIALQAADDSVDDPLARIESLKNHYPWLAQ